MGHLTELSGTKNRLLRCTEFPHPRFSQAVSFIMIVLCLWMQDLQRSFHIACISCKITTKEQEMRNIWFRWPRETLFKSFAKAQFHHASDRKKTTAIKSHWKHRSHKILSLSRTYNCILHFLHLIWPFINISANKLS